MSYEPHTFGNDDDLLEFSDDVAVPAPTVVPWRILAVDDDSDFQAAIAFSLKDAVLLDRPAILTQACSMTEAVRILAKQPEFSIVLVDVVMETDDAGLRLVKAIREMLGHFDTRIILLTGQPGFAPIDSVMSRYDLSDYCLKSDINRRGIKNILTGSLRAYRDIAAVSFARRSLNLILETSNRLVAKRRHEEIANIVLYEITRMLSLPAEGVVCVRSQECAVVEAERILVIGAAGRLAPLIGEMVSKLPDPEIAEALVKALREKRDLSTRNGQVLFFRRTCVSSITPSTFPRGGNCNRRSPNSSRCSSIRLREDLAQPSSSTTWNVRRLLTPCSILQTAMPCCGKSSGQWTIQMRHHRIC
ncbi:DUF3369 domain-containing protein [Zoogloea sp.]|uniref:DUF3369 domain-containing protein n=1 Tax=Zoogloea sp. TaxID=49181 RepID=UPI0035B2B6B8